MKIFCSLLLLLVLNRFPASAAVDTVLNAGFTFSPSSITIQAGDTVLFLLASIHTAREVTEETWNANGTTSDGGFDTPFGGGMVVLTTPGVYYYVCKVHGPSGMKGTITVSGPTAVGQGPAGLPGSFRLRQNYPNPFNPSTDIRYDLPVQSEVHLVVYDLRGNVVARLVDKTEPAGSYVIHWNAYDRPSGVYFYTFEAAGRAGSTGGYRTMGKMLLMK